MSNDAEFYGDDSFYREEAPDLGPQSEPTSAPEPEPEPERKFQLTPIPEPEPEPVKAAPTPVVESEEKPDTTKIPSPAETPEGGETSEEVDGEGEEKDDGEEKKAQVASPHARRRRTAVLSIVGVMGALLVGGILYGSSGDSPLSPQDIRGNAVPAPSDPKEQAKAQETLVSEIQRAKEYKSANGSFTGFTTRLPNSQVAASGETLVISAEINGQCTYAGTGEGLEEQVLTDDTGSACDPELMKATQEQLNEAEEQTQQMSEADASSSLETAGKMAQYYAMRNFVNTKPSFEGLSADMLGDDVELTNNTGTSVTLRHAGESGECHSVTVTWDTISQLRGC